MEINELVTAFFNEDLVVPVMPYNILLEFLKTVTLMSFEGRKTSVSQKFKFQMLSVDLSDVDKTAMIDYFNQLHYDYFDAQTYMILEASPSQLLARLEAVQSGYNPTYKRTLGSPSYTGTALGSFVQWVLTGPVRGILLDAFMTNLNNARSGVDYDRSIVVKIVQFYSRLTQQGDSRLLSDLFATIKGRAIQKARALFTAGSETLGFNDYLKMALRWLKLEESLYIRILGRASTDELIKAVQEELLERHTLTIVQLSFLDN